MATIIGIDFGTTNSLISVILSAAGKEGKVINYLNDKGFPHPSVVSYSNGTIIAGRKAKEQLEDNSETVIDDIVKSPKSKLGKGVFFIRGRELQPSVVVADLLKFLKSEAISSNNDPDTDFTKAVVSIPVAMDGRARVELRDAMLQAGIHILQFVHEPLAALYGYLKDQEDFDKSLSLLDGKLALVFDWGGGTLDLTLCQITNNKLTQLMNKGDNTVGGDFIDEAIRCYVLEKHYQEHRIAAPLPIYPGARAKLLHDCEKAKIRLSSIDKVLIKVEDYFITEPEHSKIECWITRKELNTLSEIFILRGLKTINDLLDKLNIDQRRISLCLATGGMVNTPFIKAKLLEIFSIERLEVSKKGDRIISEGCAWIAHDKLRVCLAKPIEILEARQSYLPVYKSGTPLPNEGEVITENFDMYCVDPRDGKAKFQIVRPQQIDMIAACDPRVTLGNLVINVDKYAKPFLERLNLDIIIDHNFIAKVIASSTLTGLADCCEIYDLEFALVLPDKSKKTEIATPTYTTNNESAGSPSIKARSNVARTISEALIPGEILKSYNPRALDPEYGSVTQLQVKESLYYQDCAYCKRKPCIPLCKQKYPR